MLKYPLVTVITPTYNRADYLSETIESVLSQDYPNIEYIVLDDGSTDNTLEVLEKYKGRLLWKSHPNMGETCTVNKGIGMAQGEYVVIVNSDDPILPGLVKEAVTFLEAHPNILVAYPDWIKVDAQGNPIQEVRLPEYDYHEMLRCHQCQPGPGAFIRKRAFLFVEGRNPNYRYVADFGFWLHLGLYGPFAHIPKVLATWRSHSGGATQACQSLAMAKEHITLIEDLFSRADLRRDVRQLRGQALSAAYYDAARMCLSTARAMARRYFLKCLQYYPLYPLVGSHRSLYYTLVMIETILLPASLRRPLVEIYHKLAG